MAKGKALSVEMEAMAQHMEEQNDFLREMEARLQELESEKEGAVQRHQELESEVTALRGKSERVVELQEELESLRREQHHVSGSNRKLEEQYRRLVLDHAELRKEVRRRGHWLKFPLSFPSFSHGTEALRVCIYWGTTA